MLKPMYRRAVFDGIARSGFDLLENMYSEYIHSGPDSRVDSISGHFVIQKEERVVYKGREVLVVVGYGVVDRSCCGTGACRFALVPGYLVSWGARRTSDGALISTVEPISSIEDQARIRELVESIEPHCQVNFL